MKTWYSDKKICTMTEKKMSQSQQRIKARLQKQEQARFEAIRDFTKRLTSAGFRKLLPREILMNNDRLELDFPDRVSEVNHMQEQWILSVRPEYSVIVITSIVGEQIDENLTMFVLIVRDSERIKTWRINRVVSPKHFLKSLAVVAIFARNIILDNQYEDETGRSLMKLHESRINRFNKQGEVKTYFVLEWVGEKTSFPVDYSDKKYHEDLTQQEIKIILEKYRNTDRYLDHRTASRFLRDIKKTATVGSAKK